MIGQFVIIRTVNAGVHMGILAEMTGTVVLLKQARRLWKWTGANTLNEVSLHGVGEGSRISEPVPCIMLTQAIEVIPCSPKARKILEVSRWDS